MRRSDAAASFISCFAVGFSAALAGVSTGFDTTCSTFVVGFALRDVGTGVGTTCLGSALGTCVPPHGGPDLAAVGQPDSVFVVTSATTLCFGGNGAFAFLGVVSELSNTSSRFTVGFWAAALPSSTDTLVDDLDKTVGGVTDLGVLSIHRIVWGHVWSYAMVHPCAG